MPDGRILQPQLVELVLREIGGLKFRRPAHLARHRGQSPAEQLAEGRLAVAVRAEQRDAVIRQQGQVQPRQHLALAIAGADILQRDHRRGEGLLGPRQAEGLNVAIDDHRDLAHFLKALHPRLSLAGLGGLGLEAVDEGLQVLAFRVLLFPGAGELHLLFGALLGEGRIAAAVERELALVEVQDVVDAGVEQFAIVTHHQHGMRITFQIIVEPERPFEVEIVRGLVEQQQVGLCEEDRRQGDAHAPAAGEGRTGALLRLLVEAEAMQHSGRAGRRGMRIDVDEPRGRSRRSDADRSRSRLPPSAQRVRCRRRARPRSASPEPPGASCATPPMRRPFGREIEPPSEPRSPVISLNRVVFPVPLRPSRPTRAPSGSEAEA